MAEPRKNLGWANGDPKLFPMFNVCREAGHKTGEKCLDNTHHGYDTLYFCDDCKYEFHVDSSD